MHFWEGCLSCKGFSLLSFAHFEQLTHFEVFLISIILCAHFENMENEKKKKESGSISF